MNSTRAVVGLTVIVGAAALVAGGVAFAGPDRGGARHPSDRTVVEAHARLKAPAEAGAGFAHDPKLAPAGAKVKIRSVAVAGGPGTVALTVSGLSPEYPYMAHVHVKPCAADPLASGGHYMNDPKGKADAANEVWLPFTTDRHGDATVESSHPWTFAPDRLPRSVVVHDGHQMAGMATPPARVACVTVPFA